MLLLYCRLQQWVGGGGLRWRTHKKTAVSKRKLCSSKRTLCLRHHMGSEFRSGSAGIDYEADWSCQRILFKMNQFRRRIQELRVSTFWVSGTSTDSFRRPTQQASLVSFNQFWFNNGSPDPQKSKKCWLFAPSAAFYSSKERENCSLCVFRNQQT